MTTAQVLVLKPNLKLHYHLVSNHTSQMTVVIYKKKDYKKIRKSDIMTFIAKRCVYRILD